MKEIEVNGVKVRCSPQQLAQIAQILRPGGGGGGFGYGSGQIPGQGISQIWPPQGQAGGTFPIYIPVPADEFVPDPNNPFSPDANGVFPGQMGGGFGTGFGARSATGVTRPPIPTRPTRPSRVG